MRTQDKLVSLEFDPTESCMGRNVREPVGDGGFTLESFDVPGIPGELPSGLSLAMDRQQVDAALGRPWTKTRRQRSYRRDDFLIIVFSMAGRGGRSTHSGSPGPTSIAPGNSTSSFRPLETPGAAAQPLSAPELLSFLGASPDDAAFGAWLDQHGIHDRPHAAWR